MMNHTKYKRQYYMPPEECLDWTKKEYIDKADIVFLMGGDTLEQIKNIKSLILYLIYKKEKVLQ